MRPGGGSRKGSSFERTIARQLSRWLTAGEDATQLIRSVSSGGWSRGRAAREPWRQAGDLAPNGPHGDAFCARFAVECKDRAGLDFWHLYTRTPSACWLSWWMRIIDVAAPSSTVPMLVATTLRRPVLVGLPASLTCALEGLSVWRIDLPAWHLTLVRLADLVQVSPEAVLSCADARRSAVWDALSPLRLAWPSPSSPSS